MAIGTPVLCFNGLGFVTGGSPNTLSAAISAGSLIVVAFYNANPDVTMTSVTDSSGTNTYTIVQTPAVSGIYNVGFAYCVNCPAGLTTSSTITISGNCEAAVFSISGANGGEDQSVTNNYAAQGSADTTLNMTTGTLGSASEIAFAIWQSLESSNPTSWTESTGFTNLLAGTGTSVTGNGLGLAYDIVSSTTAITYAPSWSPAGGYCTALITFKATAVGGGTITITMQGITSFGVTVQ
jgi:hypothetical protein